VRVHVHQPETGLPGIRHADHPRIDGVNDPTEIPGQSVAETAAQRMAQRYGSDRPRRRAVVVVLSAVLGTTLLVWLAWAAWVHSDPPIDAAVSAYDVVSTHESRVKVEARFRDADVEGSCLVRATAADHTIVGELNLTVAELREADGDWIPIRTEREATTVTLVRCRASD
jgi:hypothetical protein